MKTKQLKCRVRQCVVCKFDSSKGNLYDGKFVCRACESEQLEEDETRYEEGVYAELDRISNVRWE